MGPWSNHRRDDDAVAVGLHVGELFEEVADGGLDGGEDGGVAVKRAAT